MLSGHTGQASRGPRVMTLAALIAGVALLHDVGKVAVPDHVLPKPARLTDDEWTTVRRHPDEGYRIIRREPFLRNAAEIVRAHHERIDRSGYRRGLTGGQIPLGARLFAVADVFDAVTSDRMYHDVAVATRVTA